MLTTAVYRDNPSTKLDGSSSNRHPELDGGIAIFPVRDWVLNLDRAEAASAVVALPDPADAQADGPGADQLLSL